MNQYFILWNSRVSSFVIQPNIAHLKRSVTTTDSYNLETTTFGYDKNIEETTVFAMENENITGYQISIVLYMKIYYIFKFWPFIERCVIVWPILNKLAKIYKIKCTASAVHILKLERYRED